MKLANAGQVAEAMGPCGWFEKVNRYCEGSVDLVMHLWRRGLAEMPCL